MTVLSAIQLFIKVDKVIVLKIAQFCKKTQYVISFFELNVKVIKKVDNIYKTLHRF